MDQTNNNEQTIPQWKDEALTRLENVPFFVRPIVKKTVEKFAKSNGYKIIDTAVWEEAKKKKGRGM